MKKDAPTRKVSRSQARLCVRTIFPTSSSIPKLFLIRRRSNRPLYEKGTVINRPFRIAVSDWIRPITRRFSESDPLQAATSSVGSTLRGSLRRLLLFLSPGRPQSADVGLHLFALFRREQFHHLRARVATQFVDLGRFLIRA